MSLIGHDRAAEGQGEDPTRFNSHWEVESHWTDSYGGLPDCPICVSIPIGKLSLIGHVQPGRAGEIFQMFQFPLGS